MKKILLLILLLLSVPFLMALAQDPAEIPVPGSIIDIFSDLRYWFSSTATVAGLTIFLTLLVTQVWKTITAIWKQIVALVIAMLLMVGGNLANIGFMAEFTWLSTVVYGLITGFVANGLYDLKNLTK